MVEEIGSSVQREREEIHLVQHIQGRGRKWWWHVFLVLDMARHGCCGNVLRVKLLQLQETPRKALGVNIMHRHDVEICHGAVRCISRQYALQRFHEKLTKHY